MKTQTAFGKFASIVHERSFIGAYVFLRLSVGLLFFLSGWTKMTTHWSATSYLLASDGPFADWFHSLANVGWMSGLNAWGMLLLGVALLLGLCSRPASLLGMVLMVLYYLAHFTENTAHGLIEEHVVLFGVLALFAAGGLGHVAGLNSVILGNIRKPKAWMTFLLG